MAVVLALDPGQLTGYAVFDGGAPIDYGYFLTWQRLDELICSGAPHPDVVVVESFHLYAAKAQAQTGSVFVPVQVIGVAAFLAEQEDIPVVYQPASMIHSGAGKLQPPLAKLVDQLEPRRSPPYSHIRDALSHGIRFLKQQGCAVLLPQPSTNGAIVTPPQPTRNIRATVPVDDVGPSSMAKGGT